MELLLSEIITLQKGKKPKKQSSELCEGLIPYIGIKAFELGIFDSYTDGDGCAFCEEDDILIVFDGSRSGLVGRAKKGAIGSTLAKINIPSSINKSFMFYFLQKHFIKLNTNTKGTGTPHLNPILLGSFHFPILPLAEQHRIVAKIDALFSKLDKGVETLQTIRQQLRIYRQAVLKCGFDGLLTKTTLAQGILKDFIEKPRYGTSKKCAYDSGDTAVIRIPNVDYSLGKIDYSDVKYATFTLDETDPLKLIEGDILIIRSNGSASLVGRAAIIKEHDVVNLFAGY